MSCGQLSYPIDVAIAMEDMCPIAGEEGLETCWIEVFYEEEIKKILNISEEIRVAGLLTPGYFEVFLSFQERLLWSKIVKYEYR